MAASKPHKKIETTFERLAIATFSSCVGKTTRAPLDRIRLLLQCQNELIKQGRLTRSYAGIIDCTKRTLQSEGALSLWRGNLVSCVGYLPSQIGPLILNDKIKSLFKIDWKEPSWLNYSKSLIAGPIASIVTLLFSYPFDYARTRLVVDVKRKNGYQFRGAVDTVGQTYRKVGIVGLYRGFVVSFAGIIVYRSCYFALYDTLKPIVLASRSDYYSSFAFGYGVVVASSIISYPFDTLRRRMMVASFEENRYKSSIECLRRIRSTEGSAALYKGFSMNLITGITSSLVLVAYDAYIRPYFKSK